jgi:Fe-S-cluster containining protein
VLKPIISTQNNDFVINEINVFLPIKLIWFMFQLGKTIVSEEIIENDFVCNLSACKGACCIDGEAGAPLDEQELKILKDIYPKVKPFLTKEGQKTIKEQGLFITHDGEFETPLIQGADCAFINFDDKGIALCGIEEAYNQGEISWKKPISCHLYPVRVQDYSEFSAVNYHKWEICDDACILGKELQVPVYKFVKEALIRKFGLDWYEELEKVAEKNM